MAAYLVTIDSSCSQMLMDEVGGAAAVPAICIFSAEASPPSSSSTTLISLSSSSETLVQGDDDADPRELVPLPDLFSDVIRSAAGLASSSSISVLPHFLHVKTVALVLLLEDSDDRTSRIDLGDHP